MNVFRTEQEVFIVKTCPSDWIDDILREVCEKPQPDLSTKIPVVHFGIVYRNRYCAICHSLAEKELKSFRGSFDCPYMEFLNKLDKEQLKIFLSLCTLKLEYNGVLQACDASSVSKCDSQFEVRHYNKLSILCSSYLAPLNAPTFSTTNDRLFRNIHCAICNYAETSFCPPRYNMFRFVPEFRTWPTLSMILSFDEASMTVQHSGQTLLIKDDQCTSDEIFVETENKCRAVVCANGFVRSSTGCRPPEGAQYKTVDSGVTPLPETVYLSLRTQNIQKYATPYEDIIADVSGLGKRNDYNVSVLTGSSSMESAFVVLRNVRVKFVLINVLKNRRHVEEKYDIKIEMARVSNYESLKNHNCIFGKLTSYSFTGEMIFLENHAYVNDTNTAYDLSSVLLDVVMTTKDSEVQIANTIHSCSSPLDDCLLVTYMASEYVRINDTHVKISSTDHLIQIWTAFEFGENDTIRACVDAIDTQGTDFTFITGSHDSAEVLLTFVLGIVSLVCLALTFAVYAAIKALRTLPGKIVMSLVISMILAQGFLIFGTGRAQKDSACTVIAAIEHFSWLSVFTWLNTFSFDVMKTFSSDTGRGQLGHSYTFVLYSLYAWGLPVLTVTVCLILHISKYVIYAGYGLGAVCWIFNKWVLLGAFMVPVAVVMVINTAFFFKTIVSISKTKSQSKRVNSSFDMKAMCKLSVKLSLFVGVTWVFGYVAGFSNSLGIQNANMWRYLFTFINSLQGMYIFLAFVYTKRVISMIKKRYSLGTTTTTSKSNATRSTNVTSSTSPALANNRRVDKQCARSSENPPNCFSKRFGQKEKAPRKNMRCHTLQPFE